MARATLNDKGQIEIFDVPLDRVSLPLGRKDGVVSLDKSDFADLKLTQRDWDRFNTMDELGLEIPVMIHLIDGTKMTTTSTLRSITPPKRSRKKEPREYKRVRDARNRPEPTLADDLLFTRKRSPIVQRKAHETMLSELRNARRFVFDHAATERMAMMCRDSPNMIADYTEFARAPYETTWIECEAATLFDVVRGFKHNKPDEDTRIGFLFCGDHVYTAVKNATAGNKKGTALFLPQVYHLHEGMTFEQEQEVCRVLGASRMMIDSFFWGSSYAGLDPSRRRSLRASNSLTFAFDKPLPDGALSNMLTGGGAGDLRVIIALALLLVRPSMVKVIGGHAEERHRTTMGQRTFFAHNVVTIKMNPDVLIRRITNSARIEYAKRRRHDVSGTYCHNRAGRGQCVHDWQEFEPLHWECAKCHGLRWWRKAHQRGDPTVGYVTKHYVVTP